MDAFTEACGIFPLPMKAATLDDRRRLVMPSECPAHSHVIVQQIDEDTWPVKRAREERKFKRILIPVIVSVI